MKYIPNSPEAIIILKSCWFDVDYYHTNPPLEVLLWPLPGNAVPGFEVSLLPVVFPAAAGLPSSCSLGGNSSFKVESVVGTDLLECLLTLELLPQRVAGEDTDSVSFRGLFQQRRWKPGSQMRKDMFVNAHTRRAAPGAPEQDTHLLPEGFYFGRCDRLIVARTTKEIGIS